MTIFSGELGLNGLPTRVLVAEAQRRAPWCAEDNLPLLLGPSWFLCAVCRRTVDFEDADAAYFGGER